MKIHITLFIFFATLLLISLPSCTETAENQETQQESVEVPINNEEADTNALDSTSVTESITEQAEFIQESNGLEYAVMEVYLEKYRNGKLKSVRDGVSQTMNPEKHIVHLDSFLLLGNDMDFFLSKNPEFLVKPEKPVTTINNDLLSKKRISQKGFNRTKGLDFLTNEADYNNGDLLLMVSKAFYFKGAYFVHVWEFSTAKSCYHYRRLTFKFDAEQKLIDQGFINHYQKGYSGAEQFLKILNENVELPENAELPL